MNYDLDTPEGLENSITWMEQLLASIKDGGTWGIPRSLSVYTINKRDKIARRTSPDGPTDYVLTKMGWTLC